MAAAARSSVVGRAPEQLSLAEASALAGKTVALELYTPEKLPLRKIQAIGDSAEQCARQLAEQGRNPREFEFIVLRPPL